MPPDGPHSQGPPSEPENSPRELERFWYQATGDFIEQTESILRMRGDAIRREFERIGASYDLALNEYNPDADLEAQPSHLARQLHQLINAYKGQESDVAAQVANMDTVTFDGSAEITETEPYVDEEERYLSQGADSGERRRQINYHIQDNRIWRMTTNVQPDGSESEPIQEQLEAGEAAQFLGPLRDMRRLIAERVYPARM